MQKRGEWRRSTRRLTSSRMPVRDISGALTLAGLAVKARIAQFECSRFYDKADDDADLDHRTARELIDSVLAAAQRAPVV